MSKIQIFLSNSSLYLEFICALVALIQFKKIKNTYWKWFAYYLLIIFLLELISKYFFIELPSYRKFYYDFFVIPFEFIFFYWLYAYKSLNKKKLFYTITFIYLTSMIPHFFYLEKMRVINSLSYTIGVLLLMILIYLEFIKQIKSDYILQFRKNQMFYVNIGVFLFYIGTLPFWAFDIYSFENTKYIWHNYLTVFYLFLNLMYLFFIASFIWGKPIT